jgi:nitroreductase
MDAISAIQSRTSVRRFRPEPVSRELIERLLDCAIRAPNHKLTQPWRFVVLAGRAKDRLAQIRAAHRIKRFDDPSSAEALASAAKQSREVQETPVVIVAIMAVSPDENTREEDYAATMMALANLMTAAQSLGLGTYLKTGGILNEPDLLQLVGLPDGFRVVGLVSLGYPADPEPPRRRRPASELTVWLED